MTRIAFVRGEIDRTIDKDRQVRVDLDQAPQVALIPVVAAPRLVRDVFEREALTLRQIDIRCRPPPRLRDRGLEDRVELLSWNDKRAPVLLQPRRHGARAG